MTSSARFEEAKKWIDSVGPRWRLQVLSKKFRIDSKTGEKTDLPLRLRRFVEGVPWALVHDSIDYLLSVAPYSGMVYNGVEIEGKYRPTITSWTRDDKDSTVSPTSAKYNDGTYTLVQDLIEDTDSDSYAATTGGSCSEEVVTEWHWDSASIEDMPIPSQGVSYSVQAVSRNEDGTFDYALVRRTAKTQHSAEHVQSDGPFEKVTVETWDNVYGEPGSFVGVTIPSSGTSGGVQTVVRVSENQDCTFKVEVVRTTTKPNVSQSRSTERDRYASKETDVVKGAGSALPDAPDASDGNTFKHESQLQSDGTYTTSRTKESELSVGDAVVEVSVGRKGRKETVTSRNVSSPASTDVSVGGSVRNEKTPGGRFNTVVSSWVNSVKSLVGVVCKIDLFSHRHTVEKAGAGSLDDVDVSGSGTGGVVITKSTRMDDDGAVIESVETETEKTVTNSRESWTVGLSGTKHRVENRNVSSPLTSSGTIGETVVNERTPGGLYNTSIESLDKGSGKTTVGSECEKTVFEHSDSVVERNPSGVVSTSHEEDAGSGRRTTRAETLNEDGSVTVRKVTVVEKSQPEARKSVRKMRRGVVTSTTDRNVSKYAATPTNIGESQEHEKTPGGLTNFTSTTTSIVPGQKDSGYARASHLTKVHDSVVMSTGSSVEVGEEGYTDGAIKTVTADVDDYGIIKTVTRTETERNDNVLLAKSSEKTVRGTVTTTTTRGTSNEVTATNIGESQSVRITEAGNYDKTERTITPTGKKDSAYARGSALSDVSDVVSVDKGEDVGTATAVGGGGKIVTQTKDVDQYGFIKTVTRTETERNDNVLLAKSSERTVRGTVTTTTTRGTSNEVTATNIGESQSVRITEAGNYDKTERTIKATGTVDTAYSHQNFLSFANDDVTCDEGTSASVNPATGTSDSVITRTADVDQYGFIRKVTRTETAGSYVSSTMSGSTGMSNIKVAVFANALSSDVNALLSDITSGAALSKSNNGHVYYPRSQSVHVSASYNKFGKLDGSVSYTEVYPSDVLDSSASGEAFNCDVIQTSVSPVFSNVYGEDGEIVGTKVKTQKAVLKRHCSYNYGIGLGTLSGVISSGFTAAGPSIGGGICVGSQIRYDPETGRWSAMIVSGEEWSFSWEEQNDLSWSSSSSST